MADNQDIMDSIPSLSDFLQEKYGEKAPKMKPEPISNQNLAKLIPAENRQTAEIAGELENIKNQLLTTTGDVSSITKSVRNIESIVQSLVERADQEERKDQEQDTLEKSWGKLKPVDLFNIKKFTKSVELGKASLQAIKEIVEDAGGSSSALQGIMPSAGVGSIVSSMLPDGKSVIPKGGVGALSRVGRLAMNPWVLGTAALYELITNYQDEVRAMRKDIEVEKTPDSTDAAPKPAVKEKKASTPPKTPEIQGKSKDFTGLTDYVRNLRKEIDKEKGWVQPDKIATPEPTTKTKEVKNLNISERTKSHSALIEAAANKYGLDPQLLAAQIESESNGNPNAVSPKGAKGVSQLMPGTAKQYGVKDPHDPKQAIEGQAKYMRDLMKMFNNDVKKALAGYNAGQKHVIDAVKAYGNEWMEHLHEFTSAASARETRTYVRKVMGTLNLDSGIAPIPKVTPDVKVQKSTEPQVTPQKPYDINEEINRMRKEVGAQPIPQPVVIVGGQQQQSPATTPSYEVTNRKGSLNTRNPNSNLQAAQENEIRRIR